MSLGTARTFGVAEREEAGKVGGALQDEPVADYFEVPEKKEQITSRFSVSGLRAARALVTLWKIKAEIAGADPDDITLSYVLDRLVKVGADGAWAQALAAAGLQAVPDTQDEWGRLKASLYEAAGKVPPPRAVPNHKKKYDPP